MHFDFKKPSPLEVMTDQQVLALLRSVEERINAGSAAPTLLADTAAQINWRQRSPQVFQAAIEIALAQDAVTIARELAALGHQVHPDDEKLSRFARVLAPPKITGTSPAKKSLAESMNWIREHAPEYKGSWLAVDAGQFLGSAESHPALIEKLGSKASDRNLVITFIP